MAEACRLSWRRARGCALLVGVQHDRTSAARLMADMLLRLLLAALALGAGVRPAHAQGATPAPGLNRRPLLYWRPANCMSPGRSSPHAALLTPAPATSDCAGAAGGGGLAVVSNSSDLATALRNPQIGNVILDPSGQNVSDPCARLQRAPAPRAGPPLTRRRRGAQIGGGKLLLNATDWDTPVILKNRYVTVRSGEAQAWQAEVLCCRSRWRMRAPHPCCACLRVSGRDGRRRAALPLSPGAPPALRAVNGNPTAVDFQGLKWAIIIGANGTLELRDTIIHNYALRGSATNTSRYYVGGLVSWPSISAQPGSVLKACALAPPPPPAKPVRPPCALQAPAPRRVRPTPATRPARLPAPARPA